LVDDDFAVDREVPSSPRYSKSLTRTIDADRSDASQDDDEMKASRRSRRPALISSPVVPVVSLSPPPRAHRPGIGAQLTYQVA
jgi:hypothetical protein